MKKALPGLCLVALSLLACGPRPPVESGAGEVRATPTETSTAARTALYLRTITGAPVACAELLRADDQDGWLACRDAHLEGSDDDALVPVGCFDREANDWIGDCEAGEGVRSSGGQPITTGVTAPVVCDASGAWLEGTLAQFASDDASPLAVEGVEVTLVEASPEGLDGARTALVLEDARAQLRAPTDQPPVVRQVVRRDLDGDGAQDWLVAVEVPSSEGIEGRLLGALYLLREATPGQATLLLSSEIEAFTVLALADLNGDGTQEVLIENRYYEGAYTFLYRFAGDDLVQLGGWGCGA